MQRVHVFLRVSRQGNSVLRHGELLALKPIKQGEVITVKSQTQTPNFIRGNVFTPPKIPKIPLPRSNTFLAS